jgi:Protein of unknown function (DUF3168)
MTLEQDIHAQLQIITPLTAIVGSNIYPVALPKSVSATAQPWMTYQTVSRIALYHLGGDSNLAKKRIALNIWSVNYADVVNAAKAIWSSLSGFQGSLPNGTVVRLIEIANSSDSFEETALMYRAMVQLTVTYIEQ